MTTDQLEGLEFDPGFAPYILAFRGAVEYLYYDINRFKNLSQKKMRFRQYKKKILDIFDNNMGFYAGCLMWAAYIKTQPKQKILSNHCFGKPYNEEENVSDTKFCAEFVKSFPKDVHYYLGENFEFNSDIIQLIEAYESFLVLNKGFTESEYNTDIILPKVVKTGNAEGYKEIIEQALKDGNLAELLETPIFQE